MASSLPPANYERTGPISAQEIENVCAYLAKMIREGDADVRFTLSEYVPGQSGRYSFDLVFVEAPYV